MRQSRDLETFLRAPVGHYVLSEHFIVWVRTPTLLGSAVWGTPTEDDAHAFSRALDVAFAPGIARFTSLHDVQRLEALPIHVFAIVTAYLAKRARALAPRMQAQGIIVRPGYVGALLSGLFNVVPTPRAPQLFVSAAEAFRAFGHDAAFAHTLHALIERAAGFSFRARFRRVVTELGVRASVATVAHALHVSGRSLHRRLREEGAVFADELLRARLERAKSLLAAGPQSIKEVSHEVGFATPQHFSRSFRARYDMTPGEWLTELAVSTEPPHAPSKRRSSASRAKVR